MDATPPATNSVPLERNIRLLLAYDGTNYCGWQVQKNGPSIQAILERAIEKLTGEKCAVFSAGRTDSGVHALGQVANFRTTSAIPAENFRPALQSFLPYDIVILESSEAAADFHATFAAKRKHYRYLIDNSPVPLPFLRNYTYSIRRELDAEAMHAAAQLLTGTHDFRSFETDWPNKATSVRTVFEITIARRPVWDLFQRAAGFIPAERASPDVADEMRPAAWKETPARTGQTAASTVAGRQSDSAGINPAARETAGDIVSMDIIADGFLYNMVRSIMGTLINVGRGKWSQKDVEMILAARKRALAGATAPACGLFLVRVDY